MENGVKTKTGLSNYYDDLTLVADHGKYFIHLDCELTCGIYKPISSELYNMLRLEIGESNDS